MFTPQNVRFTPQNVRFTNFDLFLLFKILTFADNIIMNNYRVKTGSDDFGYASIECIDKRNLSRIRHYFINREPVQDN